MKYVIIIPDGAADEPLDELGGRTPLAAAATPHMDALAKNGRMGLVRTVPEGYEVGSDVATLSLLGYDPAKYLTGRAPLEAAAQDIPLSPSDTVFRCNLVTVIDGKMVDHSGGGISDEDARQMMNDLRRSVQYPGFEFFNGVSYRNLLVYRGREKFDLVTRPPHEILGEHVANHLPTGVGSNVLRSIITQSQRVFDVHATNARRTSEGQNGVTQVWLWGQGHAPSLPGFAEQFGVSSGAMISGVDLLRGLARLLGWSAVSSPGMTSFHDTDYASQGKTTCEAIDKFDIVISHIESPDEASHAGDWQTKVAAIEAIDREIVGPTVQRLQREREWRLLVMPDHPTNISTRKHGKAPPCFCMCGTGISADNVESYTEASAAATGWYIDPGHDLMREFLR